MGQEDVEADSAVGRVVPVAVKAEAPVGAVKTADPSGLTSAATVGRTRLKPNDYLE